jgi:hypothetical protein
VLPTVLSLEIMARTFRRFHSLYAHVRERETTTREWESDAGGMRGKGPNLVAFVGLPPTNRRGKKITVI